MDTAVSWLKSITRFGLASLGLMVLGLALLEPPCARGADSPLPSEDEQARVKKAIDRGVGYLQRTRDPSGTWADPTRRVDAYRVGHAALPGLTLLECGVAPSHGAVQRAAAYVRQHAPRTDRTYELALTILFLDRLGEKKDEALIQTCSLRLIAGQSMTGGWGYACPEIGAGTQKELLATLRRFDSQKDLGAVPAQPREAPDGGPGQETAKPRGAGLPEKFRRLAVFRDPQLMPTRDPEKRNFEPYNPTTDNSNTQFAVLALWVAGRHGLPVSRTLARMVLRFEASQNYYDGSWGYWHRVGGEPDRASMDCVGLLGLAVGYGLVRQPAQKTPPPKVIDARILKGFVALSRHIGPPPGPPDDAGVIDCYLLWSVERVAVLYGLTAIADKDWYRWGCQALLPNQSATGAWERGAYRIASGGYRQAAPVISTSFALLFLKQTNLARDLAARLPFNPVELNRSIAHSAAAVPPRSNSTPGALRREDPFKPIVKPPR